MQIVRDDKVRPVPLKDGSPTQRVSQWAVEGTVIVRFISGALQLELPVSVVAGETQIIPFDAPALAAKHGLSLFSVTIRDSVGRVAMQDTHLMLLDPTGKRLLAFIPNPPPDTRWLAPPSPVIRGRLGAEEQVRHDVPVGTPSQVVFDFAPKSKEEGPTGVQVDVVIESPEDGTVVQENQVTLVGRASTTGPAGATRIALVLDVSGSAADSSGADLDGDGKEESILQAEVEAGRLLLDALEKVEAEGPGTAFEVTILRFSDKAEVMGPLARMTDPKGVDALRKALYRIADEGFGGGTNYAPALDKAVKALGSKDEAGSRLILFLSDGVPEYGRAWMTKPALHAAARTGVAGVVIHTFGLGKAFVGERSPTISFPPGPRDGDGVNILATVAALGRVGGSVTPLPKPADVVKIIPKLPVLELPEAELKEVQVTNVTTGKRAFTVHLMPDGSFQAEVPVSLLPLGEHEANTLTATAIALDGVSKATDRVQVQGLVRRGPGSLKVVTTGAPIPGVDAPSKVELIFDASGSMWGEMRESTKIEVAKDVLKEIIKTLPGDLEVGLRVYGHRYSNKLKDKSRSCRDSELVYDFSRINKRELLRKVYDITPRGWTPIGYSLSQLEKDFHGVEGEKVVILVSDGKETCDQKETDEYYPKKVAKELAAQGFQLIRVNVVGFAIADKATADQLREIAEITGGLYFDAKNAQGLREALEQSLAGPYNVLDGSGKKVGSGWIGQEPISVPPGTYTVVVHAGGNPITIQDVRVAYEQFTLVELNKAGQKIGTQVRGPLNKGEAQRATEEAERQRLQARQAISEEAVELEEYAASLKQALAAKQTK